MPTKPGSGEGSTGKPSDFKYATAERLTSDPDIARMPTTQREWSTFIQQLNKAFANESDGWTPTFQGFSVDPSTPFCWYQRYGQVVMIEFHFGTGTSNDTTFQITNVPEAIRPYTSQTVLCRGLVDDGSQITVGSAEVTPAGLIRFFTKDHAVSDVDGLWTDLTAKGFDTNLINEPLSIMYMLRDPNKA